MCEVVDRHGGRVFADGIHAPLAYPDNQHIPYAVVSDTAVAHTVTTTSATKAWNIPGLKCARFIVSNEADAATLAAAGRHVTLGTGTHGVIATIAACDEGGPWLADVLDYLDGNRRAPAGLLAEHLPEVGYRMPEGTHLAWLDCQALGLGDRPAQYFLEKADVALTDGMECGVEGRGHARLNFVTPQPILEEIVTRLAEAVHGAGEHGSRSTQAVCDR